MNIKNWLSGNHFGVFPPTSNHKPNSEKGVTLIFTLVMIAVLSALTINLSSKMNQELSLLRNSSDYLEASTLAEGGIHYAIAILKMDEDFQADWLGEGWAEEVMLTFDEGTVKINVTDESGKINLNCLNTGKEKQLRIEQMLELCDNIGLDYAIIPAIIDWIDSDDEVTEILSITVGENKGAESDYYEGLPLPYPCKNKSFDTTEEIMMVRGIGKENYYGEKGLKNFVTVFSSEKGKININTASEQVLKATLQASLSSSEENQTETFELIDDIAVNSIMDWRIDNPFYDLSSLREFFSEGVSKKISSSGLFDVKSNFFMVVSSAKVGKIEKNITVIVERKESDIKIKYRNEN